MSTLLLSESMSVGPPWKAGEWSETTSIQGGPPHATERPRLGNFGEHNWGISASVISGEVHDRMPVFLTDEAVGEWLAPGKLEPEQKDPLLAMIDDVSSSVAGELETYAVDRQVNNVRTLERTDPSLIEPLVAS